MVQIPQYEQQIGLDAPSRDIPGVAQPTDGGIGQAVANLGGAITSVADAARARQNRMDEFNTRVSWDAFQEKQSQTLTEMERNAQGDGAGTIDGFMKWRQQEGEKFLAGITNPELRQRYGTLFTVSDSEHWSNQAANSEFKIGNTYTVDQLSTAGEKAKLGIAQNPGSYDATMRDMEERIRTAPNLEPQQRQKMLDDLHDQGPKFLAAGLEEKDPETFHFLMGLGTHQERVSYLTRRVIQAESGFDPNAESGDGASGIMQVMPDSAGVDVAKKIGDTAYLKMTTEQRKEFLKDPRNGLAYGQAYLGMMVDKYHGDVEAALVAYNAGSARADEFLAAGRDWSKIDGKWKNETQPYVSKVLDGMGPAKFVAGGVDDPTSSPSTGKRIGLVTGTQAGRRPLEMKGVNPQVVSTWEQVQGDFGRAVPVVSGFRDAATNAKAGGANHSQHIHGNALDIDVSSMSIADRKRLVQIASAHGFTGIGIYKNSIHVDMRSGAPVVWGSDHHAASVPAWAFHVAAQHRAGAYGKGVQVADASGTGGLPMSDAGPQYADGVPGGPGGVSRSGFVSPLFEGMKASDYLTMQHDAAKGYASAAQSQMAQDTADRILKDAGAGTDQPGDRKAATTALESIKDAELRKDVAPLLESHFTRWDAVQKDQQETAVKNTWAAVDEALGQNDTNAAFAIAKRAGLPPEETDKLMARIAKGPVQYDDPKVMQHLDALRFSNPEVFANGDVRKTYGDKLTNATIASLEEKQAGIRKSLAGQDDAAAKSLIETSKTANPIIDDNLKAIGVDTGAKASPEDVQHANLIRSIVGKEVEKLQQKLGRPPLISELDETVRSVMKAYPRTKPILGRFWGVKDSDVDLNEVSKAYDAEKLDITQAADALRRKGQPVNGQTLQDLLDLYKASKQ